MKQHFDRGCEYCGGYVLKANASIVGNRTPDRKVYVCENYFLDETGRPIPEDLLHDHTIKRKCDAYVLAHSPMSKYGNADTPIGRLANESLRKVRMDVNKRFMEFWTGDAIKHAWGFILAYRTEDGRRLYAKRVKEEDGIIVLKFLGTDHMMSVPKSKTETVTFRTKAYLWLAEQMRRELRSLQDLSERELIQAYNIINQTMKDYERND